MDKIADATLEIWRTLRSSDTFADALLAAYFRGKAGRELGERARAAIVAAVHGMIRNQRRIEFALQAGRKNSAGNARPTAANRDRAQYLAYGVLSGTLDLNTAAKKMPGVDWRSVERVDERIALECDPARRLALASSLPDWLAERLIEEYGDDAAPLAAALNQPAPLTIRANLLKTTRDELKKRLAAEGVRADFAPLSRSALVVNSTQSLFDLSLFREGLFEIQDEGSQFVAELAAPPPHSCIVDACAGAGGKTLALAALMGNRGRLFALDTDRRRLEQLRRRVRRAGVFNLRAIEVPRQPWGEWRESGNRTAGVSPVLGAHSRRNAGGRVLLQPAGNAELQALRGKADRVLVDVPCSGVGALRRNPDARWRMNAGDSERLARQQLAIARRALEFCKPGGRLIYATCTLLAAENERVVAALLEDSCFALLPPKEILGRALAARITDASGKYLKLLPHKHGAGGFFAAVLRRQR